MKKFCLFLGFLFWSSIIFSQISGQILDSSTGKPLQGAHITLSSVAAKRISDQSVSDKEGRFSFPFAVDGEMTLSVSYLGYKTKEFEVSENQDFSKLKISLEASIVNVGEVTVTALKSEKILKEVAMPMSVITMKDIERDRGFTVSEMLRNQPGLNMSSDGTWATSLNIRGLSEQRIVTLIDGNRVETATDIAAGMAMVDVNDIERIEVIKGAASSLYGTGALGGVVNIITKDGYFNPEFYANASLSAIYQTVNKMHSENASATIGDKKWYLRIAGTYRDAQNVQTPEGELENSMFTDNNISLKAGIKPLENHELKVNFQRYYAEDVGIPGGKSFPGPATATYPEELRNMFSTTYKIQKNGTLLKDVSLKYFHQYILRDVILIPNALAVITPSGYHTTNGVQLQTSLTPGSKHSMIAGIDVWQRRLITEREKTTNMPVKDTAGNIIGTNHIVRGEIPIPETHFLSSGIYLQDEFKALNEKLKITLGARFDLINIRNEEALDPNYLIVNDVVNYSPSQRITFIARDVINSSWSANIGFLYALNEHINISSSLSRAFRSPSIEERYKYIDLGSIVSIGDPDLKPEKGYFADLGFHIWDERLQVSVNSFVNAMNNLIVEEPGEVSYNYSDQPDHFDTLQALINTNIDEALLYGFDLSFSYNFADGLVAFGSSSVVRGLNTRKKTDLPLIPPLHGILGIKYKHQGWFGAEVTTNLVSDQDKIAQGESSTKGFATYNLRFYSRPIEIGIGRLEIFSGMDNITNRAYMNHLSTNRGIIKYEPGRNFYIRMKLSF
jgi:hemoglobin/transferrin/lactoferrin receptor protein